MPQFRKLLIQQGFSMLQFSVYARYCTSEEMAHCVPPPRHVRGCPPEGYVRLSWPSPTTSSAKWRVTLGKTTKSDRETAFPARPFLALFWL